MKAFVKAKSTEHISIMGYETEIDWSRDAVAVAILSASERVEQIERVGDTCEEIAEHHMKALKEIYAAAIGKITGDTDAYKEIFAGDDSLDTVSQVYEYLTAGYTEYRKRRMATYSPERISDEPAG